jgi:SNF2 family DNA or RNA helicase
MIVRTHNTAWLAAKIQPFVYQVTKAECLDLPKKIYGCRGFSMTSEQSALYEQAKDEIFELYANEEDLSSYMIFRLFGALQQISCGFWNRTMGLSPGFIEVPHHRLDILAGMVQPEKTIVWAKFRHDIKGIVERLSKVHGPSAVVQFHGGLNEARRADAVHRFREDALFFVATPSCAGHGLTLNEANKVIFYNNGFKYSERLQAEDRCHRIGQTLPVTYMDIICSRSIDERIDNALSKKGNVVQSFKQEVDKVKGKKNSKKKLKELVKSL